MRLLTKYLQLLEKYLSLLSKNCWSALNTSLKNRRDEPIYEEILPYDEPIYMEMNRSQSTLNSNRDAPIREADLNSTEAIYMDMGRAQPIPVSKDDPREILNVLLQLMTTINSLSTEVPDEVNIGSKQSTKASARIEVFIHIDVNNPHRFGLSCH